MTLLHGYGDGDDSPDVEGFYIPRNCILDKFASAGISKAPRHQT